MHPPGRGEHVLDVETVWLSTELPRGWADLRAMRVACCVLHDVGSGRTVAFSAEPVPGARDLRALHHFLEACRSEGCALVGHNIRGFDWEVLAGEFEARGWVPEARAWGPGAARLVDTSATLHQRLGWGVGLNKLALLNLGEGKSMDGADAPGLWRRGLRAEVLAYCRRDVELTLRVWQKGRAEGQVQVGFEPDGRPLRVPVEW